MALAAALCGAAAGCTPPAPWHPFVAEVGGFRIAFPAQPRARRAHEGPLARAYIVSTRDERGATYEAALFMLPKPLDRERRARLLRQVERGLAARPEARSTEIGDVRFGDRLARAMSIELAGGERGRWLIFYVGADQMFQLSVIGPASDELTARSVRFFDSFRLAESSP